MKETDRPGHFWGASTWEKEKGQQKGGCHRSPGSIPCAFPPQRQNSLEDVTESQQTPDRGMNARPFRDRPHLCRASAFAQGGSDVPCRHVLPHQPPPRANSHERHKSSDRNWVAELSGKRRWNLMLTMKTPTMFCSRAQQMASSLDVVPYPPPPQSTRPRRVNSQKILHHGTQVTAAFHPKFPSTA